MGDDRLDDESLFKKCRTLIPQICHFSGIMTIGYCSVYSIGTTSAEIILVLVVKQGPQAVGYKTALSHSVVL